MYGMQSEPNPASPDTLPGFELFALVKTWMDEDIVEATVRNAITQGATSVFIVDNGSTDETVQRAVNAGAEIAEVYRTEAFDGRLAQALLNAVVARESLRCGADYVWWLYLDNDEFSEGPDGLSIREYLATLDRRFRLVGAHYFNHFPTGKPEYLPGFHPIDFQPSYYDFVPTRTPPCALGHWKHSLQRFDRHGQFLSSNPGAHSGHCYDPLIEPNGGIVTHHFQYRDESFTRAKLELTCGPGSTRTALHTKEGFDGFTRRLQSLDAVYGQRWTDVITVPNKASTNHVPTPWPHVERVRRWYELEELELARSAWASAHMRAQDGAPEGSTPTTRRG
jgi:glycosyltransferase involved in cell wall biosynthesis